MAVASYRIKPTPYPLDAPTPMPATGVRDVGLPLAGQWYVGQGSFGLGTHAGRWSYDFHIVNHQLHASDPFLSDVTGSPGFSSLLEHAEQRHAAVAQALDGR